MCIINCSVSSVAKWTSHSRPRVRVQISGLHADCHSSSSKQLENLQSCPRTDTDYECSLSWDNQVLGPPACKWTGCLSPICIKPLLLQLMQTQRTFVTPFPLTHCHFVTKKTCLEKMQSRDHCLHAVLPTNRPLSNMLGPEVMTLSCPDVHLICMNDLSSLTFCLNLLTCELAFIYVCTASCKMSAYVCYV